MDGFALPIALINFTFVLFFLYLAVRCNKVCPFCKCVIRRKATVCPRCTRDLQTKAGTPTAEPKRRAVGCPYCGQKIELLTTFKGTISCPQCKQTLSVE